MRGKVPFRFVVVACGGITPAYAGKSRKWTGTRLRTWDHPRLCGEKRLFSVLPAYHKGSPPPMRGKVRTGKLRHEQPRITPAYAGKSFQFAFQGFRFWDHPRLCGEKLIFLGASKVFEGSPPPMRGKVIQDCRSRQCIGITPAYAGKSPGGWSVPLSCWDHPRLCGEKYKI